MLEPFCASLAGTKRPALAARLQDGVFGELLARSSAGGDAPLATLDLRALGGRLFDLGAPPCHPLCGGFHSPCHAEACGSRPALLCHRCSSLTGPCEASRSRRAHAVVLEPGPGQPPSRGASVDDAHRETGALQARRRR